MDLTKIINNAILSQPPDEPRRYIGASSIGKECSRQIWYGFTNTLGKSFPSALKNTFEVGKRLEGMILDYLQLAGLNIERPNEENRQLFVHDMEVYNFQGHMDGILHLVGDTPAVLEIKTAKNSSFQKFKNHGLKLWSPSYYAQIQSYMGMAGLFHGVILAMNKDTSEYHHEWVAFDPIFYSEMRMKALSIATIGEPPERINRNPTFFICQRCQYKEICHG